MQNYQIIFSILSAIILFLFGLNSFSHELRRAAGNQLQSIMSKITANRFTAFFAGAIVTAIIQSSTAVSSLAVSLVDSSVLSFSGAIAIMLGSYVGTTTTAWLVSLKLTGIGPIFIVLGGLLSALPIRARIFGKALFYFGFIFFSLDLIGSSLDPLKSNPAILKLLLTAHGPFVGILIGILLTIVLQSSTVVTGLAIVFVQQELLMPLDSIAIVLGANIGTTATALLASIRMNMNARKTAVANTLINTFGVLMLFPFLEPFGQMILKISPTPSMVVAFAHLGFNLVLVSVFLAFLNPFVRFMNRMFTAEKTVAKGSV